MLKRLPADLPDKLRDAGIPIYEAPGWHKRGRDFQLGVVGGMQHHWGTSAAGRGTVEAGHSWPKYKSQDPAGIGGGLRTDGRVICNVFSDRDGGIALIAAGGSNFSSCYGSTTVFNEVQANKWPGGTAKERGLGIYTMCGNNFFLNLEAEHAGDGSPMPEVQELNIAKFWAVMLPLLDLSVMQLIGHNEWTARKIDPRWNGPGNRMPVLRQMVENALLYEDLPDPPPTTPPPTQGDDIVSKLPDLQFSDGFNNPTPGGRTAHNIHVQKLQALLAVAGFIAANTFDRNHRPDGKFGNGTRGAVKDFQVSAGLDPDGYVGQLTWSAVILYD